MDSPKIRRSLARPPGGAWVVFFLELRSTSCLEDVKEACRGFNNYEQPGDSGEITLQN